MADKEWPIKVVGIEAVKHRSLPSTRVDFDVDRGDFLAPLRLTVNVTADADDAALIPVARSYLAHTLERLAEQTASWKLNEEEFRALVPKKPTP